MHIIINDVVAKDSAHVTDCHRICWIWPIRTGIWDHLGFEPKVFILAAGQRWSGEPERLHDLHEGALRELATCDIAVKNYLQSIYTTITLVGGWLYLT